MTAPLFVLWLLLLAVWPFSSLAFAPSTSFASRSALIDLPSCFSKQQISSVHRFEGFSLSQSTRVMSLPATSSIDWRAYLATVKALSFKYAVAAKYYLMAAQELVVRKFIEARQAALAIAAQQSQRTKKETVILLQRLKMQNKNNKAASVVSKPTTPTSLKSRQSSLFGVDPTASSRADDSTSAFVDQTLQQVMSPAIPQTKDQVASPAVFSLQRSSTSTLTAAVNHQANIIAVKPRQHESLQERLDRVKDGMLTPQEKRDFIATTLGRQRAAELLMRGMDREPVDGRRTTSTTIKKNSIDELISPDRFRRYQSFIRVNHKRIATPATTKYASDSSSTATAVATAVTATSTHASVGTVLPKASSPQTTSFLPVSTGNSLLPASSQAALNIPSFEDITANAKAADDSTVAKSFSIDQQQRSKKWGVDMSRYV